MFASTAFSHFRFGTFCLALLALLAAHTVSAQTTYTISGQVNKGASPLAGVTMTLGGSQTGTATTNSSGDYSFTAPSGGNYTVTPSLAGYSFSPQNDTFDDLSMNETGNFVTSVGPPHAPPLTQSPTQPNLFFGAVPPNDPTGPVLVLVHGLDGSYENWIETWDCPTNLPTCKGSNNFMYDSMYASGYRVAIMSLNLNNANNTSSIQTNSAMLQTLFPQILANFNVTQVYFIAHSKGGLDLQNAIANPQWLPMAKMVMLLATPNQGDALADWCYSPAGAGACAALGLENPAIQSMETANVLQLRTQWDPVFQNSGIPFYTLAGNTYNCGSSGGGTCATVITGETLCTITGGTVSAQGVCKGAPKNDGLVTEPETYLPTNYAMALAVVQSNHYGMVQAINTFVFVQSRVTQQDNSQPGISRVGTGGFGDEHNTWAWSSAWFNGQLYVGTGREVYCVTSATSFVQLGLPGLYPPAIGDCTPDYHDLPLQAEIWQYTPGTNTWVRVFQSQNSLSTVDNAGKTVATARDIGFRSLTLVTEPGNPPVNALYAGGVTSGEIFQTETSGSWPPPRILRSVDGVNWAPLPQDAGTFLAELTEMGNSQFPNFSIRAGQQLNGVLFLQVGDFPGVGRVFSSIPGTNPAGGNNNYQWASPPTADLPIWILENFNGYVYAGTGTPPGAPLGTYGIFKTNGQGAAPYTWAPVITDGAYAVGLVSDYAMSMQIFLTPDCPGPLGCLYAGTDRPNEMVRIHPDSTGQVPGQSGGDSWDLVIGDPRTVPPGQPGAGVLAAPLSGMGQYFNNGFTGHFWRMGVTYNLSKLYMGTWDWSSDNSYEPTFAPLWAQEFGTDLWSTTDGTHWYTESKIGMGDGNNTGSRSFATTPFGLYMGTARSIGGAQVFNVNNSTLDYNNDGVIDQLDVNIMTGYLGQPATPGAVDFTMDLNQNGIIDPGDVTLFESQCTYPGCAVPPTLPPYIIVSAPVLYSTPGALADPVSLSWSAISNAQYYTLYRIAVSPSETATPPGFNNGPNMPSITKGVGTVNPAFAAACRTNAYVGRLQTCAEAVQGEALTCGQTNSHCGFPGPPVIVGRFPATQLTYSEAPVVSGFQAMYYVRAEDGLGNLSSPSNIAGGPSLAAQ